MPFINNIYRPILFGESNESLINNYNEEFGSSFSEADFLFSNVYRIYKTIDQGIVQASNEFAQFEAFIVDKLSSQFSESKEVVQDATILGLTSRIKAVEVVQDVAIANPNSVANSTPAGTINIVIQYNKSEPLSNSEKREVANAIFTSAGDSTEFIGSEIVTLELQEVNLIYDIKWDIAIEKTVVMVVNITYTATSADASPVEDIKENILRIFQENQGIGKAIKTQLYTNPADYIGVDAITIAWTYDGSPQSTPVIAVAANELPTLALADITVT